MKAKIKETGKWITINPCNEGFYDVETHDIYLPDELDFAAELDWQAFRGEAAKDILNSIISAASKIYEFESLNKRIWCEQAIDWADELIRQLQERHDNDD